MLLLKLLLVPTLVGVVTLAVRRWGPVVGGWLAGLPIVAGPVLVFYALEQGLAFAARAAYGTLTGLLATVVFVVSYGRATTRAPWYACVALGWTGFGIAVLALQAAPIGPVSSLVLVAVATSLGRLALPRVTAQPPVSAVRHSRLDLPLRLAATATLVVSLTGLADELGSSLSGLLNAFPVLTTIVAAFTHAQHGRAGAIAFLNGYLQSVTGFALFCLVMAVALPSAGLVRALVAALVVQFVSHGVLLWRVSGVPVTMRP